MWKWFGLIMLIILLTVLTQVGGIILVIHRLIWHFTIQKKKRLTSIKKPYLFGISTFSFLLFYSLFTFLFLPLIAAPFGRVPLPIMSDEKIQPLNILTCFMNRHYVKPEMLHAVQSVSTDMEKAYPGSSIVYLDANFPFMDNFPLLPHKSHDDGEKLDLAFFYQDLKTGKQLNDAAPSFIGYGVFEEPNIAEQNQPEICRKKGYWQYSILRTVVPEWNKDNYLFDAKRTKKLVELFAKHKSIGKIFIEPHLKKRMNIYSNKVRYHGCGAVRHDDHIHIQL